MPGIFDWSATPASNSTVDGINIAEGCPAGNVNNALRSLMALVRQSFSSGLAGFLSGTSSLPVANGGTGSNTAAGARTNLGVTFGNVVSSDFANTGNGYIKLNNGLIIQWGQGSASSPSQGVNFPTAFPSACLWAGACNAASAPPGAFHGVGGLGKTGMVVHSASSAGVGVTGVAFYWLAIGV